MSLLSIIRYATRDSSDIFCGRHSFEIQIDDIGRYVSIRGWKLLITDKWPIHTRIMRCVSGRIPLRGINNVSYRNRLHIPIVVFEEPHLCNRYASTRYDLNYQSANIVLQRLVFIVDD